MIINKIDFKINFPQKVIKILDLFFCLGIHGHNYNYNNSLQFASNTQTKY